MSHKFGRIVSTATRKQRLTAIKAIVIYLERIRDAEKHCLESAALATHWRCETELIASVIDEAIMVLEDLY